MTDHKNRQDGMSKEDTARLIIDFFHRTMMHHAMWFSEVRRNLGDKKAYEALGAVHERSYGIQMKRLSQILNFEMAGDIPKGLLNLSEDMLVGLKEAMAVNWLANDGVWFQAVEFTENMDHAKKCNDACWAQFSPFEAWSIKKYLGLPEQGGIAELKQALNFRLYASINTQSFVDETPNSIVFQMNECRVQGIRKRKGLDDYPCKSGGMVEYATFASAINPEFKTECICCPPDDHPEDVYCAWRFILEE